VDAWVLEHVNGLAGHLAWLGKVMIFITHYGPYLLIAAFVALWFWPGEEGRRSHRQLAVVVTAAGVLLALGLNQVIVHTWARPRPFVGHAVHLLVTGSTDPSFPSDHATFAFAAATGLFMVNRWLGAAAAVFAAVVAISRVFVGVHYPTDVIAGAAIGCAFVLLVYSQRRLVARATEPFLRRLRRVHLA
jgi:undecaprenyl-diphosphatase